MSLNSSRLHLGPVALLLVALALAAAAAAVPRAQAQGLPALCSSDFFVAVAPPTLTVTATPAIINANSGTSTIVASPRNQPFVNPLIPQLGCEVALSTDLGSFVITSLPTVIALTDAQGDATEVFRCDGVVGTATITALISLPPNNILGPTLTATTPVECTETEVPDLSIEKSHEPEPFVFGGQGQITLTVTNNGPVPAGGFFVTDSLPPGFTFLSASDGDWACTASGQDVTCLYVGPALDPGESATVTLTVEVGDPSDFTGGPVFHPVSIDVDNCATVVAEAADPDPDNDTDCDVIVMKGSPGGAGVITIPILAGTSIVGAPVELMSFDLIAQIPDLTVWFLRDGMWEVDSARLPSSLRMNIVIPQGSGFIAITETGGEVATDICPGCPPWDL